MLRLLLLLLTAFPALAFAAMLATGSTHALVIDNTADGEVLAWGDNAKGQIGNGNTKNANYPTKVFGLSKIISVSAGDGFSLALDSSGYVWAWGANDKGQLGDTTTSMRITPVRVSRLNGVIQIAAGNSFALAVKDDGTVWAWGSNSKGQLGTASDTTPFLAAPAQISGSGFEKIIKAAAGVEHALAIKEDGSVWSWGSNDKGQLGLGHNTDNNVPTCVALPTGTVIDEVSAGNHSLALQSNGALWAWGKNDMGQLGDDTTSDRNSPVPVADITEVGAITVAPTWSVAIQRDGSMWAWGDNEKGQLLDNTMTQRHYPVKAQGLSDIVSVATGLNFTVTGDYTGNIVAWGVNNKGQLGSGDTKDNFSASTVKKNSSSALILDTTSKSASVAVAHVSGTPNSLTLSATITPSQVDQSRTGFPLIWASVPGVGEIYLTVFGWFQSDHPVPYSGMGLLRPIEVPILNNFDASTLHGTKVFAGYGFVPSEGAGPGRTSELYTVP